MDKVAGVPRGPKATWVAQAEMIIKQGYPAVAESLPELLAWLQDINWPGAQEIADFLVAVGAPVIPHVRCVLQGSDRVWQYWVLNFLVNKWPRELVAGLEAELMKLIWLTDGEEVDIAALRQLAKHRLGDREVVARAIERKQRSYRELLDELSEIAGFLGG